MKDHFQAVSLNVGKPQAMKFKNKTIETGIMKVPVKNPVWLSALNLSGDGQADLKHHGGKDKAVCVYPIDHYQYWEREWGRPLPPGTFGENLTVIGLTEQNAHIGDTFEFGEAVVQITQPRQPCFKLAGKLGVPDMALKIQQTGFSGFYFRVLKEGAVSANDTLKRTGIHPQNITVSFANRIKYHDRFNERAILRIMALDELSESWRASFAKRLARRLG